MQSFSFRLAVLTVLCLPATLQLQAQNLASSASEVSFFSKTPMEDIAAVNRKAKSVINTSNGEIAVYLKNIDFKFPNGLMEEHFNENYMETEKYPTGLFKGKIQEAVDYSKTGKVNVTAVGTLEMHGVKREKTLSGTLDITDKDITLNSGVKVKLEEFKIERPSVVMMKIADEIDVKVKFVYPVLKK